MRHVNISRRTRILLILSMAVWAASRSGISVAWAQRQNPPVKVLAYPDMILYNGKVLTADDQFTLTEAVAIRDGKFLEVGKNDAVLELAGPNTRKIDLKGLTVTPGFIIHHQHMPDYAHFGGLRDELERNIKLEGRWYPGQDKIVWDNVDQLLRDVKKAVDAAKPGEWVELVASQESWPLLTKLKRSQLDAISAGHPVQFLSPITGVLAANSLALKAAKISPEISGYPPDDDARLKQGEEGEGEGEASWLLSLAARWAGYEKLAPALKKKIAQYQRDGYTFLAGTRTNPADLTALRELWVKGELNMRYRAALMVLNKDAHPEKTLRQLGNLSDVGDDMFGINGMSFDSTDSGIHTEGFWSGHEKAAALVKYGWSTGQMHSYGEIGTRDALNAFADGKKNPIAKSPNQRLAVDHLVLVRPEDLVRFKELGVQPSISPWFLFHPGKRQEGIQNNGIEKMMQSMAVKSYIDLGLKPDIEGDIDGSPYRTPLWSMEKYITRKDDETGKVWNLKEKITRQQALWMMTNWATYYVGFEKKLGTIEPGKLADLVVLGKDFMTVPEDEIGKIPVLMTMVGGQIVYQADGTF